MFLQLYQDQVDGALSSGVREECRPEAARGTPAALSAPSA